MDERDVDALARLLAGGETRRAALRLLTGGALGGLAARLGLIEVTEAKKRQKAQEPEDKPRAEGKSKGKKSSKSKKKSKSKSKSRKCGAECTDDGGWCCANGLCVDQGTCCPGEKRCLDGSCISLGQCCSDDRRCADGSCIAADQCCPDEHRCGPGPCIPINQCCSNQTRCEDGSCVSEDECCPEAPAPLCPENEQIICCRGQLHCRAAWDEPTCHPYGGWLEYNAANCRCECPGDSVEQPGTPYCCPADYPEMYGLICTGDVWNDWACPLGFGPCEGYPQDCCPIDWPPPQPERPGNVATRHGDDVSIDRRMTSPTGSSKQTQTGAGVSVKRVRGGRRPESRRHRREKRGPRA